MKNLKNLAWILLFLFLAPFIAAQSTTVSATVVDSDSTTWANGTWSVAFVPSPDNPNIGIYNQNGTPLSNSVLFQSGTLDGSGALSFSIYQTSSISPSGSGWKITVCPNASTPCGTYNFTTSTSTLNISSALTTTIPAPRFHAIAGTYGYTDAEAVVKLLNGNTYYNVNDACQRYYDGTTWTCGGGGTSISLTTLGTSGPSTLNTGVLNIPVYSSGYNPSTTAYLFATFSGLYDDDDLQSTALPVSSYICAAGTCTVNFTSSDNLTVGGAVDMHNTTGWPNVTYMPQLGSFQILTTPSGTQVTFASSVTHTCSSSCGTAYDASYWAVWQSARQSYIYGHGTIYGTETTYGHSEVTLTTLAASFNTYVNCSLGSPTYLIIEAGQDDLLAGTSASAIESALSSIWTQAFNNGCVIVQNTIVPAEYGIVSYSVWQSALQINRYIYTHADTIIGQYHGRIADPASTLSDTLIYGTMPYHAPNSIFAAILNNSFSTQGSAIPNLPPFITPIAGDGGQGMYFGSIVDFWDSTFFTWMHWDSTEHGIKLMQSNVANNNSLFEMWNNQIGSGGTWCADQFGFSNSSNGNFICRNFHYVADDDVDNYFSMNFNGYSPFIVAYRDGRIQFPSLAGTGTNCAQIDSSGFMTNTGSPCGSSGSSDYINLCSLVTLSNATCVSGSIIPTGTPAIITISAIPATNPNLHITMQGSLSNSADGDIDAQFNGDTGSNYLVARWFNGSNNPTGSSTFCQLGNLGSSGNFGGAHGDILQYGSTGKKLAMFNSYESADPLNFQDSCTWAGTAAITSIALFPQGGQNFNSDVKITIASTY